MIEFRNVSYFYNKGLQSQVEALFSINLSIKPGEFVSIVGLNGSGKSTLAKLFNGLIKPSQGEVLVDGTIGLLFQNPDNQIVGTIAEEDLAFGPENLGVPRDEITRRIDSVLESIGMSNFRMREPHTLSAGQKQKIALGSVLTMQPDYLILDEPTAYLDPAGRQDVLELLLKIHKELGIAIVNITHFPQQLLYSQRIVALNKGQIVFDGSVEDFFNDQKLLGLMKIEPPLWWQIKEQYKLSFNDLESVHSAKDLAQILCLSS